MVLRNIVKIDRDKCNGCGACVNACVEGAIEIVDGKARLVSERYCDGLGACLGKCPQDAITVEQREADAFDEQAVQKHLSGQKRLPNDFVPSEADHSHNGFSCPGMQSLHFDRQRPSAAEAGHRCVSQLRHWPVQLKLVSPEAEYFQNCDLLLVADCVPFAMGDFHQRFLTGRSVVVGCPKLDDAAYYIDKLAEILKTAHPRSLTVIHMEVPCCSGLVRIAKEAMAQSGESPVFEDITIGLQGQVKE